jgi:CRP-like cAMP-binding protein
VETARLWRDDHVVSEGDDMFTKKHPNSYTDLLARTHPFNGCSRRELRRVAELVTLMDVAPGRRLTTQGGAGEECFVVLHGQALVERDGTLIATIDDGGVVGELALLDRVPRTGTVTTKDRTTLFVMSRGEFASLRHLAFPSVQRYLEVVAEARRQQLRDVAHERAIGEAKIA